MDQSSSGCSHLIAMQRIQSSICNPSRRILAYLPEYDKYQYPNIWVFGPHFKGKEVDFTRKVKQEILDLVLGKSGRNFSQLLAEMGNIEEAARAAYEDDALKNLEGPGFLQMMAKDGCLFLCLAFIIIGRNSYGEEFCREMDCAKNLPCLGLGFVKEKLKMWLSSLFLVGNQIPYVVLDMLMKLSFFQKLKRGHEWPLPMELPKRALHQFLMADDHQPCESKPVDLIHCLQLIIVGTKLHRDIPTMKEDSGEIREDDIPPARELSERGVTFETIEADLGSRGIHYRRWMFSAYLYYPVFRVDRFTELMIHCIHNYEIVQPREVNAADASSHFKLLSDLIRTPQDVELLLSRGVIQGQVEGLPELLMRNCRDMVVSDPHLRRVTRDINKYPPRLCWWKNLEPVTESFFKVSAFLAALYIILQMQSAIIQTIKEYHH